MTSDPNELLRMCRAGAASLAQEFDRLDAACKAGNLPVDWQYNDACGKALGRRDERIAKLEDFKECAQEAFRVRDVIAKEYREKIAELEAEVERLRSLREAAELVCLSFESDSDGITSVGSTVDLDVLRNAVEVLGDDEIPDALPPFPEHATHYCAGCDIYYNTAECPMCTPGEGGAGR